MRKTQLASCFIVASLLVASQFTRAADPDHPDQPIISPAEAMSRLKEGNGRFTAGNPQHPHESVDERKYMAANSYENAGTISLGLTSEQATKRRSELTKSQHPFAIILSCSDSRVPPEIVFDQGLGDLFIVRVAGNVATDTEIGSLEYGAEHLHIPLLVVLGHESCGAVTAAVQGGEPEGHIGALVDLLKPAVEKSRGLPGDPVANAVRTNVQLVVEQLRTSTPVLSELVAQGKLKIVGGVYSLETGKVTWLSPE